MPSVINNKINMKNLDFSLLSVVCMNFTLKKLPENSHTGSLIIFLKKTSF
jgi:hypothetical protein